jgi:hypothetical protein
VEKPKRDPVTPEMRARLLANREGRLTPAQWGEMIAQPLVVLILLGGFAIAGFGPRLLPLLRLWWLVVPVLLLIVFTPVVLRAFRYARAPIHFARLSAGVQPWRGLRKPMVFYTETDEEVKFPRKLAPRLPLVIDAEYMIYYLDEPDGKVLLSAAPADHEDAEAWLPTRNFEARQRRRAG